MILWCLKEGPNSSKREESRGSFELSLLAVRRKTRRVANRCYLSSRPARERTHEAFVLLEGPQWLDRRFCRRLSQLLQKLCRTNPLAHSTRSGRASGRPNCAIFGTAVASLPLSSCWGSVSHAPAASWHRFRDSIPRTSEVRFQP